MREREHREQKAAGTLEAETYRECRRLAASMMRAERSGHTLSATALVNEAAARLWAQASLPQAGSPGFYEAFGLTMRRVLVDHARARRRLRRGGDRRRLTLSALEVSRECEAEALDELDLEALDMALKRLAEHDPRAATIATMKLFAGAPVQEISAHVGLATSSVHHEWQHARMWLEREVARISR